MPAAALLCSNGAPLGLVLLLLTQRIDQSLHCWREKEKMPACDPTNLSFRSEIRFHVFKIQIEQAFQTWTVAWKKGSSEHFNQSREENSGKFTQILFKPCWESTKFWTVFFIQKSDGSFQKQNLRGRFGSTSSAFALNLGSLLSCCQEPHKNSTEDCFLNLVLPQQKVCYRFPQSARISRDAAPTRLQRKKTWKISDL